MIVSSFMLSACIFGVVNIANSNEIKNNNQKGICSSTRIYNSVDNLRRLDHCEVIEGSLKIVLLERATTDEFSNVSFPLLKEITGYLLLFKIKGLKSIGQLFPNLSIIRGHETIRGSSLILYDLPDLEDIGLYSLAEITHGQVYINDSPSLCYVNTIDWGYIVKEKSGGVFIKKQNIKNNCPKCEMTKLKSNEKCFSEYDKEGNGKYLCWNRNHCQKICPPGCKSCNNKLECCNEKCLACSDEDVNTCTVCSNYIEEKGSQKNCTDVCSPSTFKLSNRRCINRNQCLEMGRKLQVDNNCVLKCSDGYTVMDDYCVPREQCGCKMYCSVNSISPITNFRAMTSRQFTGCTHLIGSLDLADVMKEHQGYQTTMEYLERILGKIEEIRGYLIVKDLKDVTSLDFLKNLKEIKGEEKFGGNYSLVVENNINLSNLWKNNNVRIRDGKLQIRSNPKLCNQKIVEFQKKSGVVMDNAEFNDDVNKGLECKRQDLDEDIDFENELLNIVYVKRTSNDT